LEAVFPMSSWTGKLANLRCWEPYQAMTGEDRLRKLRACYSELYSAWINDSAVITCSYNLKESNKSNYQSKSRDNIVTWRSSLTRGALYSVVMVQ
jgi:hypothetical protein